MILLVLIHCHIYFVGGARSTSGLNELIRSCNRGSEWDDTVMQELFENLLDHHHNFVHPQEKKKTSKKPGMKKNMNRKCLAKNLVSSKKKTPKK